MMSAVASVPRFSVVIPSYQRPHALDACLAALAAQDLPVTEYEVIVVDDGSATPPRTVVDRFAAQMHVRLIEQRNAGPAAARNAGARAACGEYVVFTDDDCRPDTRWLSSLGVCADTHPGAAIGGRILNALQERMTSTASQLLIDFLYRYHNTERTRAQFLITSNLALPRRTFLALSGFDVSFPLAAGEDRDLCERWLTAGHVMLYCPTAAVHHAHELTISAFCRQHFNYGRGAHHLHRARARRGQGGFRLEPARFYLQLIFAPLREPLSLRAVGLSALLALSQGAYAVGYALERMASRVASTPLVRA